MEHGIIKKIFLLILTVILLIHLKLYASNPADSVPDDLFPAVNYLLEYMESNAKKTLTLDVIPRALQIII